MPLLRWNTSQVELIEEAYPDEFSAIQRLILRGGNSSFENPSFNTLLDEVCERLQSASYKGSLRRIQKLEEILAVLEMELEELQKEASLSSMR
jgi:hypothetical protein